MPAMTREQSQAQGDQRYQQWLQQSGGAAQGVNQSYGGLAGQNPNASEAMRKFLLNSNASNYLSPFATQRMQGMAPELALGQAVSSITGSGQLSPSGTFGSYIQNAMRGGGSAGTAQGGPTSQNWAARGSQLANYMNSVYGAPGGSGVGPGSATVSGRTGGTEAGDLDAWFRSDDAPAALNQMTQLINKGRYSPLFSNGLNQQVQQGFSDWESGGYGDSEIRNWLELLNNLGLYGGSASYGNPY